MTINDIENAITVPYQHVTEAEPACCFVNVENYCEQHGGLPVIGWLVTEEKLYYELLHHCIWQSPEGNLLDITPQVTTYDADHDAVISWPHIQFLPDPEARLRGEKPNRIPLPTRFIAKVNDSNVKKGLEFLGISNEAYYQGDYERGNYYTKRAQDQINRYLKPKREWICLDPISRHARWRHF